MSQLLHPFNPFKHFSWMFIPHLGHLTTTFLLKARPKEKVQQVSVGEKVVTRTKPGISWTSSRWILSSWISTSTSLASRSSSICSSSLPSSSSSVKPGLASLDSLSKSLVPKSFSPLPEKFSLQLPTLENKLSPPLSLILTKPVRATNCIKWCWMIHCSKRYSWLNLRLDSVNIFSRQ